MRNVYLDNNATTQVAPEVTEAMMPFFKDLWGNPSSMHYFGGQVGKHIEDAREKVADIIGAIPSEIIFTSCGTEANNSAISGAVEAMGKAIKEVDINNEQVETVAEALGGIAGEINNINSMLDQMAAASEQQSSTSEEISRNVISISQLAEKTSKGTEHINLAENEIGSVSARLNQIISTFKV